MFNYILYGGCLLVFVISWNKDRQKTKKALLKAWKSFENILPQFLGVLVLVGIILAYFKSDVIGKILGDQSGWWGVIVGAVIGAVTLIPGFVAFPTAAVLLKNGAGMMQMGAFISALMMVGVVTIPVEIKYFGRKLTIYRNLLAFLFSFLVAWIIGVVAK